MATQRLQARIVSPLLAYSTNSKQLVVRGQIMQPVLPLSTWSTFYLKHNFFPMSTFSHIFTIFKSGSPFSSFETVKVTFCKKVIRPIMCLYVPKCLETIYFEITEVLVLFVYYEIGKRRLYLYKPFHKKRNKESNRFASTTKLRCVNP